MSIWLLSNLRKILISSSAASAIIAICRYTSVDIDSRNFLAFFGVSRWSLLAISLDLQHSFSLKWRHTQASLMPTKSLVSCGQERIRKKDKSPHRLLRRRMTLLGRLQVSHATATQKFGVHVPNLSATRHYGHTCGMCVKTCPLLSLATCFANITFKSGECQISAVIDSFPDMNCCTYS